MFIIVLIMLLLSSFARLKKLIITYFKQQHSSQLNLIASFMNMVFSPVKENTESLLGYCSFLTAYVILLYNDL